MNEDQRQEAPEVSREDYLRDLRRKRWKRRRSWAQARSSGITVLVLGGLLLLTALFLLVFPRSTISKIENRTLTPFPKFSFSSYFAGEFTAGVASHYDDTVPYRDSFKNVGNRFKGLFGLRSGESTVTIINKPMNDLEAPAKDKEGEGETADDGSTAVTPGETSSTAQPEPEEPNQKDFRAEEAEFGLSNGLMVVYQDGHWKCLSLFGGGDGQVYADALNTLQQKVGPKVKIWSMPCPLSSQFYVPSNAEDYSNDQQVCMNKVAEKLDSRITHVDVCPELQKHTEEEIYCRTDHHWQALGAYYACKVFAEAAGVPYLDLDKDFVKGKNEGYVGTMYAYSEDSRILNDPEDFTYYKPKVPYDAYFYDEYFNYQFHRDDLFFETDTDSSYLMYIGGDGYVVKVNTNVHNGRKLIVIKDSYGNAEIPFLVGSFEQIYVADMRYLERNLPNFIKSQGITDVLFSMCTYSVVGGNAECLTSLMTQDPDSEIVDEQPAISAAAAAEEAEEQRQAEEEARAAEEEAKAAEEAAQAAEQAAKDAGGDAT